MTKNLAASAGKKKLGIANESKKVFARILDKFLGALIYQK